MDKVDRHISKLRVLLVQHELLDWPSANSWSYSWHLGIEEGLRANNAKFFTITSPWFSAVRKMCKGKKFDQVWINDIAHLWEHGNIGQAELEWLEGLAPIRVGFAIESLEYAPEIYAAFPFLKERRPKIELFLRYVTHAVVTDEKDAEEINAHWGVPAIWAVLAAVPERYIIQRPPPPSQKVAIFSGKIYHERKNWLEYPQLKNLLAYQGSSEDHTIYPLLFDKLHSVRVYRFAEKNLSLAPTVYSVYLHLLRHIRRRCFSLWLRSLHSGVAVVNLPSLGKVYGSRVFEGMAAGRPVIAWEVPDRPKNKALFKEGEEILLYRDNEPMQVVEHIQHILSDPGFGRRIAENGQRKIKCFHTSEKRVQQILNWIETGRIPKYD